MNYALLLPKKLVKGKEFSNKSKKDYAKSREFASLFGINYDVDFLTDNSYYLGFELTKKEIFHIMKTHSIKFKSLMLHHGKFPCGWFECYKFVKVDVDIYQLRWYDDGLPG